MSDTSGLFASGIRHEATLHPHETAISIPYLECFFPVETAYGQACSSPEMRRKKASNSEPIRLVPPWVQVQSQKVVMRGRAWPVLILPR